MDNRKHNYHVTYVTTKSELLGFDVDATNWQELKDAIDAQLPPDADYICGISYNKWTTDWSE